MIHAEMTTLCYIEKDDAYLMMHRTKKKQDINADKWIGVGGHFEPGEGPEDCLLREVKEETGLMLTDYRFRGLVTFIADGCPLEMMCLYTADGFVDADGNWWCPAEDADGNQWRSPAEDSCDGSDAHDTVDKVATKPCDEGELVWVKKSDLDTLNLWEGDKIFLRLLAMDYPFFSLKLRYRGDELVEAKLDGEPTNADEIGGIPIS